MMKEQWNISESNTLANMEEGLYQKTQQHTKESEYKINCCTQCIPYLRFIFLFEVMLFFGWGCYMILQTYHSREIKNETINITFDRYPSMIELFSSEIQKSRPSTEMPVIKPEIIKDKISNILEDMKFTKDPMQNEAIENVSRMQTNMQNSNNVRNNNMVGISAVNRLFATRLSGNLVNDEKFTKNSVPEKFFSFESIDEDVSTDDFSLTPFLEKLRNISKIKATNDLEQFKSRNDVNHLALEKNALIASNKLENLELDVATISNPENFVDHTISVDLTNIFQDPKQEFSDLVKDVAQDENRSLYKETDERVNACLGLDLVIPRYPKFFDILKDSVTVSSISQPLLAQEISEIETESSDNIDERSEDKHDINDSDMLMSASVPEDQDYVDISMDTLQNTEEQHSSKTIATIKEDDKYESTENIKNPFRFFQPAVQDSVEFSTPNIDEFQWFNAPPSFVDLGLEDKSELSEIRGSLLRDMDTYEDMDVDDVIPGSQCKITIEMDILKVTCPDIKFDEEWNFTLPEIPQIDVPEVTNFGDVFDVYLRTECDENANKKLEVENISNENSDKEVTASRDSVSKIINATELQESTTNAKIPNVFQTLLDLTLSDAAAIEPFDSEEINQDYASYDSLYDFNDDDFNDEVEQITTVSPSVSEFGSSTIGSNKGQNPFLDISDTQQEQLKVNKEQDYSVSDNNETSLKAFEHFYALEKELISLLKNEISDIMTRYLPKSSYENNYQNNICSIFRYMRSISQHPWREQYVALSKLLENIQNPDYPRDMDDSYRKKRMTDHLTWQQDQVSNTLEEDNDVNSLEKNLRKIFQKMEILALCIDRLHERYLLHNKLDDDYASSEFPLESEALDTSRIVYEK